MPQQPKRPFEEQFFGPALIGACLAVVLSVPAAAFVAAAVGDTYEVRATVYGLFLGWAFIGAICIFIRTFRAERKPVTIGRIALWFASVWLWPLLLLLPKKKH